jgi:hypothetical protein
MHPTLRWLYTPDILKSAHVIEYDGLHYPSYSETQRRHLEFREDSTKRKKWCANDCQGRVYFTSDQIVYLPVSR